MLPKNVGLYLVIIELIVSSQKVLCFNMNSSFLLMIKLPWQVIAIQSDVFICPLPSNRQR